MVKYQVTNISEAQAQMIKGAFLPGSTPVNIPDDEKLKPRYTSLFLHQKDIETGIDCLHCVNGQNSITINYALFTAAIINLIKCFQKSDTRVILNENTFLKKNKDVEADFTKYKNWRNNYFAHAGNGMLESKSFLLLAPDGTENVLGGPVSTCWREVQAIDYLQEAVLLEKVMQAVWRFICCEIDTIGEILYKKYSNKSRQELRSYGVIGTSLDANATYTLEQIKSMRNDGGKIDG